jgi:small-conductance mechanosensitive channel
MIDLGPLNFLTHYDLIGALVIIILSLVASKLINFFLVKVVHHFAKRTKTSLDDELVNALRRPIFLAVLLYGLYLAAQSVEFLAPYSYRIDKVAVVLGILVMFYAVVRIVNALFKWYGAEVAGRTKTDLDDKYISIFKRVLDIFLYIIAGMIILRYLGIEITPLLAGLGIGGLAVALALQDTLSNFFAGFYILTDKSIRVGDYIELENGMGGYVDDISWRTTRIKTLEDNYVIMPNSKLAQSITTNYYFGKHEMSLSIPVEVSYRSDLDKVEKLAVAVARDVQKTVEGAKKDYEPTVRFKEFGESNIKFSVVLRVNRFADKYLVRHELIKRLKKEFDAKGIEISYPARNIYIRK